MDCPICANLKRVYEAGLAEYIRARSSVSFRICTKLAARKNVDMERARYALEEHRRRCVTAIKLVALLPKRKLPASVRISSLPMLLPRHA
jgi:hypothetical protein